MRSFPNKEVTCTIAGWNSANAISLVSSKTNYADCARPSLTFLKTAPTEQRGFSSINRLILHWLRDSKKVKGGFLIRRAINPSFL